MQRRTAIYFRSLGTPGELGQDLRQTVEARGDTLVGVYTEPAPGRYAGWKALLANLDQIDQIVMNDVGDLPGRTVKDLLALLATLTAHGVSIVVPPLHIDTGHGVAAVIALTAEYQRAKKSLAIQRGQERARKAGRRIGRPPIPIIIRQRILAELAAGAGIRSTARKLGVSPAAVINIRRRMAMNSDVLAA